MYKIRTVKTKDFYQTKLKCDHPELNPERFVKVVSDSALAIIDEQRLGHIFN